MGNESTYQVCGINSIKCMLRPFLRVWFSLDKLHCLVYVQEMLLPGVSTSSLWLVEAVIRAFSAFVGLGDSMS